MQDNKHIKEFLDMYLLPSTKHDYAVLITGCWGSGKTHYIKNYLLGCKTDSPNVFKVKDWLTDCDNYTVIYVSLFGLKTFEDVDNQIDGFLRSNLAAGKYDDIPNTIGLVTALSVLALGTIATGGTSPVIIPAVVAASGTIKETTKLFARDFIKKLKNKKNYKNLVIIFDDVERADMPLPSLLGYINRYVEHLQIPCIMLADKERWEEAELVQKDCSTLHSLSSTKEKVIGKEFHIQTSLDTVWCSWFDQEHHLLGDDAHRLLKDKKAVISKIVDAAKICNFRSLQHSFFDLQRFIEKINRSSLKKEEFNTLFVADFISHQYAYYLGLFDPKKIFDSDSHIASRILSKGAVNNDFLLQSNLIDSKTTAVNLNIVHPNSNVDENPKSYENFKTIFANVERLSSLNDSSFANLWLQIWKEWLIENTADYARINEIIDSSIWYKGCDEYYLRRLLDWFLLDDDTGKKAMDAFYNSVNSQNKKLKSPSLIMDLFYRLLWYSKKKVIKETPRQFINMMTKYVKSIKNELIDEYMENWKSMRALDGTYEDNRVENDKFLALLCQLLKEKQMAREEKINKDFLDMLVDNSFETYKRACDRLSLYFPSTEGFSLSKIEAIEFCEAYQKINPERTRLLIDALKVRYRNQQKLNEEKDFLKRVLKESEKIYKVHEKPLPVSVFSLFYLIRELKDILKVQTKTTSKRTKHA